MKIGIIGKGKAGKALGAGLERAGHEIMYGHRDPKERVADAAEFGEVLILAVPFSQVKDTVEEMEGKGKGKAIIDVTNAVGPGLTLAIGWNTSGAEELQKMIPEAKVVKAFNYAFAINQSTGTVKGRRLSAFVAGDDAEAKRMAMNLARDIGFDPIDSGGLVNARYLESRGMFIMNLAFNQDMGVEIGYELVR